MTDSRETPDERKPGKGLQLRLQCIIGPLSDCPARCENMMRKLPIVLSLALMTAIVTTAGCGIVYRQPIYQGNLLEKTNVDQLQTGMSKQQVMLLLGSPSITDPFHHDRWDYTSTQRTDRLASTEVKNLTLWFEGETLSRWDGDYFPEQDEQIADSARKQFGPNLPKDRAPQGGR